MAYHIWAECIACGACIDVCPGNFISEDDPIYIIDSGCWECGNCVDVCPVEAIRAYSPNNKALVNKGSRASSLTYNKDFGLEVLTAVGDIICDGVSNMLRVFLRQSMTRTIKWGVPASQVFAFDPSAAKPIILPVSLDWYMAGYSFEVSSSTGGDYDQITVSMYGWSVSSLSATFDFYVIGWK